MNNTKKSITENTHENNEADKKGKKKTKLTLTDGEKMTSN